MTTMGKSRGIQVTVTIDFGSFGARKIEQRVAVAEKATVLDALKSAVPIITTHKFGMEHFVEAIGGLRDDRVNDRGWLFEVNGYRSDVPAERYLVKNGDWIRWRYGSSC